MYVGFFPLLSRDVGVYKPCHALMQRLDSLELTTWFLTSPVVLINSWVSIPLMCKGLRGFRACCASMQESCPSKRLKI